jgi:hypothetical protein
MDHFRTKKQGNVSFRESKIMNILKLGMDRSWQYGNPMVMNLKQVLKYRFSIAPEVRIAGAKSSKFTRTNGNLTYSSGP